jgi:hypothetical protein
MEQLNVWWRKNEDCQYDPDENNDYMFDFIDTGE